VISQHKNPTFPKKKRASVRKREFLPINQRFLRQTIDYHFSRSLTVFNHNHNFFVEKNLGTSMELLSSVKKIKSTNRGVMHFGQAK